MAEVSLMRWMFAKDLHRRGKCDKVNHPDGYCTFFSRDGLDCSFISKGDCSSESGSGGFVRCFAFTG